MKAILVSTCNLKGVNIMKNINTAGEIVAAASHHTKEREYWVKKLSGELVRASFPYDRKIANERNLTSLPLNFSDEIYTKLMKLSNNSDPRLHMVLIAAVTALLARYTGLDDIIIGSPIYKQEVEGDYINTMLVLRNQLTENMSFKDLILKTRQLLLEVVENQNYPIEALLYQMDFALKEKQFSIIDTIVLLENIQERKFIENTSANFIFSFRRTEVAIEGVIEYNSELYNRTTVEQIATHFSRLLTAVLGDLNLPIEKIAIHSEAEEEQLIFGYNRTEADYPKEKIVSELFEEQVEKTPENIAAVFENQEWTYRDLNAKANQLAWELKEFGVGPGKIVGIMMDRSLEFVIGILAVLKAGGAYLPIDPVYPKNRIEYMLQDSDVQLLLVKGLSTQLSGFSGTILNLEENNLYQGETANLEKTAGPDDLAYIIYTSGTTGKPKGVMVEHRGLTNYLWWAAKHYVQGEKIDFPLYTSVSFDLTITSIFTPLITGNAVVIYGTVNMEFLIEKVIAENRVDAIKLTPSHLKLIRWKKLKNSRVKRLILGGESLKTDLAKEINNNFEGKVEIYNEYGPTETVVGCMIYKYNPLLDEAPTVPIGVPAANTQIYILDSQQRQMPIGATGELYISGDGVARGYLNRPELTSAKFLPNPFILGKRMYRTGDLARWRKDGNIEFIGRIDQQVKFRGFRIELGEIDSQLLKHNQIKEVLTVVSEDKTNHQYLCSYYVAEQPLPIEELRQHLLQELPEYMLPTFFVHLDVMPLTLNGKVDHKLLPKPEKSRQKSEVNFVAPHTEMEKLLAKIWCEVLGVNEVGIYENFFDMGAHSINVVEVIAQLEEVIGKVSLLSLCSNTQPLLN